MESSQPQSDSTELRSVLGSLRQRRWLILACVIGTTASALVFSLLQEKEYSAEASLLFRDPGFDQRLFGAPSFEAGLDPTREAETNVRLVSLDVVADATAEQLPELSGDEVDEQVSVEAQGQSDVVSVIATDDDPESAAALANTFAEEYIAFRREADQAKVQEAEDRVSEELAGMSTEEKAEREGQSLQDQLNDLKTLEALQTGNAELVQPATAPDDPSAPQTARNTVVGGVLGLLLGLGLALLLERLDRRLKDPSDLEESFSLPVLGVVPDSKILAHMIDEHGVLEPLPFSEAEAFRMLRSRLRYFNVDRDIRSLLVTSAAPGEGKSTVALNLALTATSAGSKVLLLEADLHQHTLAESLDLQPLPGLAEVLTGQSTFENALQRVPVERRTEDKEGARSLNILVAGTSPPNPAELMESEEMTKLIDLVEAEYDLVIIDTPPISVLADAIPLLTQTTGVVVVGQLGRTTADDAAHLVGQLRSLDAPLLGVVANRARKRQGIYAYGSYGYGGSGSK